MGSGTTDTNVMDRSTRFWTRSFSRARLKKQVSKWCLRDSSIWINWSKEQKGCGRLMGITCVRSAGILFCDTNMGASASHKSFARRLGGLGLWRIFNFHSMF